MLSWLANGQRAKNECAGGTLPSQLERCDAFIADTDVVLTSSW